jgi:hypothetical protein
MDAPSPSGGVRVLSIRMKDTGSERHVKVLFQLEQDEDGYPPASVESLWALPKGEGLFQVDNIPFFATGVAL